MSKRVFQLRKKLDAGNSSANDQPAPQIASVKQHSSLENKSYISSLTAKPQHEADNNISQRMQEQQEPVNAISLGPRLSMNRSYIHFEKIVDRVDLKQVNISNVGSSAIYYEWVKLPRARINTNAIRDQTPKFFCHHDKNVIKPGENISFVFSFLSKLPGIFIEEYEFRCQPELITPLPILKLEGKAIIIDEYEAARKTHSEDLKKDFLEKNIREILSDLIDTVKSPEEPRPNMEDPQTAAKQFEKHNASYGIFYNQFVFRWWKGLYSEVADRLSIPTQEQYWNGSVNDIRELIGRLPDEVDRICFTERLDNYLQWSRKKRPDQSALYGSVREILCKLILSTAGQFNDTARKELEMWQVPWREPIDPSNEAQKKVRDEEVSKIKAEWLKKAKKKKWGEEEEKALVADYRNRLDTRLKEAMLNAFEEFDGSASYTRMDALTNKPPLAKSYFRWLERLKTVKEAEVEGRKILLKVELSLRSGGEARLPEMREYFDKKKEYEKKLEEERKEQEGKDKKKPKKAAKKKQQELVAPEFDIMSVLDEQSCKDIVEIIKNLQERSPKILIVACSFGPKRGIELASFGLEFFWEYVKPLTDPSMAFVRLSELPSMNDRLENDFYSEGSVVMLENINFLPAEALTTEVDGKVTQPLMDEIMEGVHLFESLTDVFVNDNRTQYESGLALYLKRENVLGLSWWRQIGIALKAENSDMIVAGSLTPQKLLLLEASIWYAKRVFLVGEIGVKFAMVTNNIQSAFNLKISPAESKAITTVIKRMTAQWQPHLPKHKKSPEPLRAQFIYPQDILIGNEGQWKDVSVDAKSVPLNQQKIEEQDKSRIVLDVGQLTVIHLLEYASSSKHVFLIDRLPLDTHCLFSTEQLFKHFYKMREARSIRHQEEQKKGINYRFDTIMTFVGDFEADAQQIQLKEKPVIKREDNEEEPEEEKPEQEEGEPIRNLTLLQDFNLTSDSYILRLLAGEFIPSLSNIDTYPESDD